MDQQNLYNNNIFIKTNTIQSQIMSHRANAYDPDSTNLNKLWSLEQNRSNHLKNLSTIYKQKQSIRIKTLKDHQKRQNQLNKYQLMKLNDYDYRNKSMQDKINYQNALLRNKILQLYQKSRGLKQKDNKQKQKQKQKEGDINNINIYSNDINSINIKPKKKSRSMYIKQTDRISPYKASQAQQMYRTNLRIGQRLTNIKSQVGAVCGLNEHIKKSEMLLEMIQKKSPKKRAYLKSLTRKKFFCDLILPELELSQHHSLN